MSDLISRAEAIKAIEDLPNCYNGFSDTYDKACIIGTLEEVPSAEPKIIRCKDCKHQEVEWHEDRRRKDGGYMIYWCNLCEDPFVAHGVCGEPKGYCPLAEKKGKVD